LLHFPEISLPTGLAAVSATDHNPHRYGRGNPGVQKEAAPSQFTGKIQKLTESITAAQHRSGFPLENFTLQQSVTGNQTEIPKG